MCNKTKIYLKSPYGVDKGITCLVSEKGTSFQSYEFDWVLNINLNKDYFSGLSELIRGASFSFTFEYPVPTIAPGTQQMFIQVKLL